MPTPFADPKLWQHATFTFIVPGSTTGIDARGNSSGIGIAIPITFKIKPSGDGGLKQGEATSEGNPTYAAKVVAVGNDFNNFKLPTEINVGDIGEGEVEGRKVRAIIKSVSQSGLSPLLVSILGSSCTLEIDYRIRRGSEG